MTQELWTAVDRYVSDVLGLEDDVLLKAQAACDKAGLPSIQVSPGLGKFLEIVVRMIDAKKILEVGTLGGYSTICMARGMGPGGRLITLEIDPLHARVARENFDRAGLGDTIELREGKAIDTLPQLESDGAGPFDLAFIDADKASNPDYFQWALRMSRPGTVIIVDNVIRDGAVIDAESEDASVRGVRRLNEMMAAERRVVCTELQTVGVKGYDGFALTRVVK